MVEVTPMPCLNLLVGILLIGGDIEENDDNVTNDQKSYHDERVEEVPPEPPVELELRRSTRMRQVSQRYPPHEYVMVIKNGEYLMNIYYLG